MNGPFERAGIALLAALAACGSGPAPAAKTDSAGNALVSCAADADCKGTASAGVSGACDTGTHTCRLVKLSIRRIGAGIVTGTLGGVVAFSCDDSATSQCSAGFDPGTAVTLTATPGGSAAFVGWMESSVPILNGNTNLGGVIASPDCAAPNLATLTPNPTGQSCGLLATLYPANQGAGGTWKAGNAQSATNSSGRTIYAVFTGGGAGLVPIDVDIEGQGTVTVGDLTCVSPTTSPDPACEKIAGAGSTVTITGTPAPGWLAPAFDAACPGGVCTVWGPIETAVTFAPDPAQEFSVTAGFAGTGNGEISSDVFDLAMAQLVCNTASSGSCTDTFTGDATHGVKLTAEPASDSVFGGWTNCPETPSGGILTGFNLVQGAGYQVPPTVTLSGGGGSGASAIASLTGRNGSGTYDTLVLTLTKPGKNYGSAPTVALDYRGVAAWVPNTAYTVGSIARNPATNGGSPYICTVAGTSAASGGPAGTGSAITDGTAQWAYAGPATAATATAIVAPNVCPIKKADTIGGTPTASFTHK